MKINVLVAGLVLGLAVACSSSQPDMDHGVSNASYRDALQTVDDKIGNLIKRLQAARDEDLALSKPFHASAWWESQINAAVEADKLARATLAGSNAAIASGAVK